jgi:galactonate dehydratase
MKIARIETLKVPPRWLFVRVETDDGAVGWGEATLEGHGGAVEGAFSELRERFVGADPFRIEDCWQIGYRGGFYRGGPVLMSALSGLDQALWDIKGKALGVPVWQLLGGKVRDRIQCYAWIGGDKPEEVGEAAAGRREQGFKAIKMNATSELRWLDTPASLKATVARVAAVRNEGVDAALDFHGRVHKPMARQLADRLMEVSPLFIEEPMLSENIEGLRQIANMSHVPIAAGERLYSRWDFKRFFEEGILDIAQPDLSHAGGLSECRRIAAMAEVYDIAIAPHCPLGPIAFAACLQLAATTPNFAIQEMSLQIHYNTGGHDLPTYLADQALITLDDGYVRVPEGPGLGVVLDEQIIREEAAAYESWQNPVWRNPDGGFTEW